MCLVVVGRSIEIASGALDPFFALRQATGVCLKNARAGDDVGAKIAWRGRLDFRVDLAR